MEFDITKHIDTVIELVLTYTPKILLAIVVLFVGFRLVRVATTVMNKALYHEKVDQSLASFLESLVGIILKGLVIITVANMVGIEMTSFIALLGAAGLAIGLSLQGSLSNFAGGILILLFKPFKVGDTIEAQGHRGKVDSIQIVNTVLRTVDNKTIVIPNGQISNGTIENYSTQAHRRLDMVFGISYDDDIQKAKQVLRDVISQNSRVLKDQEVLIAVTNLGASSVDIECRMWCKGSDYHPLRFEMNENVKLRFDAEGISFPYPQQDIHVNMNPVVSHEPHHGGLKNPAVSNTESMMEPTGELAEVDED